MSLILRRYDAHAERIADEQRIARILLETGEPAPIRVGFATPAGDERRLRGIPAIGRGVAGACTDSIPHQQRSHNDAIA